MIPLATTLSATFDAIHPLPEVFSKFSKINKLTRGNQSSSTKHVNQLHKTMVIFMQSSPPTATSPDTPRRPEYKTSADDTLSTGDS
jgi:hypothetical protein